MLLKQAAAHVAVQAEGEKFIDVGDSLLDCVCESKKKSVESETFFTSGFIVILMIVSAANA